MVRKQKRMVHGARDEIGISIVVAVRAGSKPVLNLLGSLAQLKERDSLEVLVVNCCGDDTARSIIRHFPEQTVLTAPPGCTLVQARYTGVERSRGEVVAILHERYTVGDGWLAALRQGHRGTADVVVGVVVPVAGFKPLEWAIYLTEYSRMASAAQRDALDPDDAAMIPGGNVSYKRRMFALAPMADALWEFDFHQALYRAGAHFLRAAGMVAEYGCPPQLDEYLDERWQVSRDFAAVRARRLGSAARVTSALSRLALPPLLLLRIVRATTAIPAMRAHLWRALPWIVRFSAVQMAAEIQGFLAGVGRARPSAD